MIQSIIEYNNFFEKKFSKIYRGKKMLYNFRAI